MSGQAMCRWCRNSYRADRVGGNPPPLRCARGRVVTAHDEAGTPRRCGDYVREPGADDDRSEWDAGTDERGIRWRGYEVKL